MSGRRSLAGTALLAVAMACIATPAAAIPPRPADLRVRGGEDTWHRENRFMLDWAAPSTGEGPPLAATRYRIRDPQGAAIDESRIAWVSDGIAAVTLPSRPGAYTAEVWFEDTAGVQGPAATAQLRFDDVRPAAIEPEPVPAWIGRTSFPLRIRLGHPAGPAPVSGIRGYAVTIDAVPGGNPCAAADSCSDAETALRGGIGDDELTVAALPEGTSYLHAVAVSGSGMKSPTSGQAVLRVDTTDPIVRLAGAPGDWTNRAVALTASATDASAGMEPDGDSPPPFTAIRIDGGAPIVAPGDSVSLDAIAEGAHRIAYYARDAAGNVADGGGANGLANRPPQTTWVRVDRTPPNLAFANSQDPSDPDLLRVRVGDSLSGADTSRGRIGVRLVGSGDRFEPLPAAPPAGGELRARWDSDAYPAGEYEFRAVGYDSAGNRADTTQRRNGEAMVLSNPLKTTTAVRTAFPRRGTLRAVPYGRGVRFEGGLATGSGSPLGGMPVRIVERFAAGAQPPERATAAWTGPGGGFSIRLAPGPSRTISVGFDGSPSLARAAGRTLRLQVRSRVRLRASSAQATVGGAPLVFRGRVDAAPGEIPGAGKSVQLQFRLPGLPWAEFRTIQTDRLGRFRHAYRFSDDDSRGVRFQFRAYATAQDDWPYEPAGSRPVVVRGR